MKWYQVCAETCFHLQYLAEAGWTAEGRVVGVTQPRRVAAVTVSFLFAGKTLPVSSILVTYFFLLSYKLQMNMTLLLKNLILQLKKNYGLIIFVKLIPVHHEFLCNNKVLKSNRKSN